LDCGGEARSKKQGEKAVVVVDVVAVDVVVVCLFVLN
jgi:hypothetical protein